MKQHIYTVAQQYNSLCRSLYFATLLGARKHGQLAVFLVLGTVVLAVGSQSALVAQSVTSPGDIATQERFSELVNRAFNLIEGNLGALVMVVAGLMAIISAAFGGFRAALSMLAVAVGAFVLRSLVGIFFNFQNAQ